MPSLLDRLIGEPLASWEDENERIGVWRGVPSLGLDALSSAAYGPEAALTILLPLGAAGLPWMQPIVWAILGLLAILYFSYRQTIAAYPSGGGSYTVARENLGIRFGLLAAAALMLDYILNVAVGISAGVAALTSAAPSLHPYTLLLCLGLLLLLTLANIRGAREAGAIFAAPTYLFIASMVGVLTIGGVRAALALAHGGGHPAPVVSPPPLPAPATGASSWTGFALVWLLLRAFASGCTAMTGVEAVSNGAGVFRKPTVQRAQGTLTVIVGALALLLVGIAWLVRIYGIGAMDQTRPGYQSVLSQLTEAIVGRGPLYYVAIGSVIAVLALSANTSYTGFPRLCRLVALDGYLPHPFALLGRRLVYTVGILFLSTLAAVLLLVFGGITDRLIPLFAVGAFLAFTLSQTGMVVHWRRHDRTERGRAAARAVSLWINAVGAVATAAALGIIIAAKFLEGAWITLLILPGLLLLFTAVKRHYDAVARRICCPRPLQLTRAATEPPIVVLPVVGWNMVTEKALQFALNLSPDVVAVHVATEENGTPPSAPSTASDTPATSATFATSTASNAPSSSLMEYAGQDPETVRRHWTEAVETPLRSAGIRPPRLDILRSPYRRMSRPLIEYLDGLQREASGRLLAVVIPELVEARWWEMLLHNHRATALKAALLLRGGPRVVVIDVPWYLHDPRPPDDRR